MAKQRLIITIGNEVLSTRETVQKYPLESLLYLQRAGTFSHEGEALLSAFGGAAKILKICDAHPEWKEKGFQRNILEQI